MYERMRAQIREKTPVFPIKPNTLRKVSCLCFIQDRYLTKHLSDRKFVIQAWPLGLSWIVLLKI